MQPSTPLSARTCRFTRWTRGDCKPSLPWAMPAPGACAGASAYNGSALQNNLDANFNTQEVMATLSSDTGGKAFFDSNDFSPAFERIQQDTSSYYAIGFRSSDPHRDGRYRRLTVKVNRSNVKLEYRPGYYAPADFQHSNKEDRERELEEELASDLPATDVEVYLQAITSAATRVQFPAISTCPCP